jgi:hypothetical protein
LFISICLGKDYFKLKYQIYAFNTRKATEGFVQHGFGKSGGSVLPARSGSGGRRNTYRQASVWLIKVWFSALNPIAIGMVKIATFF